jgi:hypothetical protein
MRASAISAKALQSSTIYRSTPRSFQASGDTGQEKIAPQNSVSGGSEKLECGDVGNWDSRGPGNIGSGSCRLGVVSSWPFSAGLGGPVVVSVGEVSNSAFITARRPPRATMSLRVKLSISHLKRNATRHNWMVTYRVTAESHT